MEIREDVKLKAYNAIIPIITLIVVVFVGIWYTGYQDLGAGTSFSEAFSNGGDSFKALLWGGSLTASLVAIVMGVAQKKFTQWKRPLTLGWKVQNPWLSPVPY